MDNKNVIASALSDNELARAFSELVAERWDNWDLTPFLPYLADVCAPAALPYLADQFDIDGLRGFGMAATEEQQRDIIKRSIALHKFMGTPWAIREACRVMGFPVIRLDEGVIFQNNGAYGNAYGRAYDITIERESWACFNVLVEADMARHITIDDVQKIRLFIESYKNERSHLVDLGFGQTLVENLFRPDVDDRENLEIITLSISPNPIVIDPSGAKKSTSITVNIDWMIEQSEYDWSDGTGDKVRLTFTGASGTSQITVESDEGRGVVREMDIPVKSVDGRFLGNLTIRQQIQWKAYSRGYSEGYSRVSGPFIALSTDKINFPPPAPDDEDVGVVSNVDWAIN